MGRSKKLRPPANRFASQAPARLSRVLPTATPSAVPRLQGVVNSTASAPRRMPGQTRYPSTRRAATARPEGGHTGVTLGRINGKRQSELSNNEVNDRQGGGHRQILPKTRRFHFRRMLIAARLRQQRQGAELTRPRELACGEQAESTCPDLESHAPVGTEVLLNRKKRATGRHDAFGSELAKMRQRRHFI